MRISAIKFNEIQDRQIGSIVNKNSAFREEMLTRNIGRYGLYSVTFTPAIGSIYETWMSENEPPMGIAAVNGLIGYNSGIVDDTEIASRERYHQGVKTVDGSVVDKVQSASIALSPSAFNTYKQQEASNGKQTREVFTTNTGGYLIGGGPIALDMARREVNEYLSSANKRTYWSQVQDNRNNALKLIIEGISKNNGLSISHIGGSGWGETFQSAKTEGGNRIGNVYTTYNEPDATGNQPVNRGNIINDTLQNNDILTFMEGSTSTPDAQKNLLEKTNKLFEQRKIKSIINRFHTDTEDSKTVSLIQSAVNSKYGLSRGRNLLKENPTTEHGYDNPYCRVWTAHHQYNNMLRRIRPFADGESFKSIAATQENYGEGYRPNKGNARLSDLSVLKKNGLVNIAPHMQENQNVLDKESIKKCMFSIENLAWKDMIGDNKVIRKIIGSTGTTEAGTVLSEEQRGPNGGRIMWFPPYNLSFSEQIATNWNDNSFIGRGEKIYTYTNTDRTGTLHFTLLVDHPSVVNQWKNNKNFAINESNEQKILRYFAGCDDLNDAIRGTERDVFENEVVKSTSLKPGEKLQEVKVAVFFPNNYTGIESESTKGFIDYLLEGKSDDGKGTQIANKGYEVGNKDGQVVEEGYRQQGEYGTWYYRIDEKYIDQKLASDNYSDKKSFHLNDYSADDNVTKKEIIDRLALKDFAASDLFSLKDFNDALNHKSGANAVLSNILREMKNLRYIKIKGMASSHNVTNPELNDELATNRAEQIKNWLRTTSLSGTSIAVEETGVYNVGTTESVSDIKAKVGRCAIVTIAFGQEMEKSASEQIENESATQVKTKNEAINESVRTLLSDKMIELTTANRSQLAYDDEYTYFKELQENDALSYKRIIEKIQYFSPAYHSITPEGFNARLTFLNQCSRQGPTFSAADDTDNNLRAGNLAFGRAPICVLRIGDFYNTKIVIQSITINYQKADAITWDLNPEGVGVQPMMADIDISFTFIGGSDLSGPIERLQNAISFNYYSNTSIYDRRADYREKPIGGTQANNPLNYWDGKPPKKEEENKTTGAKK